MEWIRQFAWKRFFYELYEKAMETDLLGRAAQIGFYFSFALFPLLLVLLTLFGLIIGWTDSLQRELYSYLAEVMPRSAYVLVRTTMDEIVASSSGGKLTLGIVVTLWSASAGIDCLRNALNSVYEVDETWAWWKLKLQSLVLTLLFILLLGVGLAIVTAGVQLIETGGAAIGYSVTPSWFLTLIQWASLLVVLILSTAVVYSWLPRLDRFRWVWISPGSIIAITLWIIFTGGFRLYLHYFDSYNKVYGSLGAVIILMLWMYLTGLALLVGGAINSVLTEMSPTAGAEAAQEGEIEHEIRNLRKKQHSKQAS